MRTLVTVTIDNEAGNRAIRDGTMSKIMETFTREHKPEAVYFTALDGKRTGLFVVDIASSSAIPAIAEPFFMQLGAHVDFKPVMNVEELRAGLQKLGR
ncbi:MAG: hypothetical protein ACM3PU_06180 [Gemmatimonadota bacterium]